jgi:hypothetical protein
MSDVESRWRLWIQALLCLAGLALALLTAVAPSWIEDVLGIDPDGGSGLVEWLVVLLFASAGMAFGIRAGRGLRGSGPPVSSD